MTTLPFFGFDPTLVVPSASAPPKQYDILYVGHNWWRWKEVREELLPAFELIRGQVGEIGLRRPVVGPRSGVGGGEGFGAGISGRHTTNSVDWASASSRRSPFTASDPQNEHRPGQHFLAASVPPPCQVSNAAIFRGVLRRIRYPC